MTKLEIFLEAPLKNLHASYKKSFLHMKPAPETATGEILLASLYRNVGFLSQVSEGSVTANGKGFLKTLSKGERPTNKESAINIKNTLWARIVKNSLSSPKQPQQSRSRFLQINPIVPDAAIYSLSARLTSNPWNPGRLIAKMMVYGSESNGAALELWQKIFDALTVDNQTDDIWARLLQAEFETWRKNELVDAWKRPIELQSDEMRISANDLDFSHPAKQFVIDLNAILNLKTQMTRRQWISMIESTLRIGAASHIMWLCRANYICFEILENASKGQEPPSESDLKDMLSLKEGFWALGQKSSKAIVDIVEKFALGRVGINLLLWHFEETGGIDIPTDPLKNPSQIIEFAQQIYMKRKKLNIIRYDENLDAIFEARLHEATSSNISEFLNYVLKQRQTMEPGMEAYDQGYYLKKRGPSKSAPWIVSLGPVSIIAMVHCCTALSRGPRTVSDLSLHLTRYGFDKLPMDHGSDFGKLLRSLNLIIDSPDAEGGVLLVDPFKVRSTT
jgi:hypothetical protein